MPIESSPVRKAVLADIKESAPSGKRLSINGSTPLQTGACIDFEKYHGLIHDLCLKFDVDVSPEEADALLQSTPTVDDLAALIERKIQETAKAV